MKTVYQKYETDCGPASVAMLCGVGLARAKAAIYDGKNAGLTSSGKLLDAIRGFGGQPKAHRCQSAADQDLAELEWDALLKGELLIENKKVGHWAVWDNQQQTIRNPYGYFYPFQVTHFVEIAWP